MSASLSTEVPTAMPTAAKKPKRADRRTMARERTKELKRLAKLESAKRQEERDEAIAPAVQRKAVLLPNGDVLRAPRVERDGVVFIRANPLMRIEWGVEQGKSMFTSEHMAAAKRLVVTWDAVGGGVGPGTFDWGSARGTRGTAPMQPPGHAAMLAQVKQEMELSLIYNRMRHLWPMWQCMEAVVLRGMSPTAWAAKFQINKNMAYGILLSSLSVLVEIYSGIDGKDAPKKSRIRTVTVGSRSEGGG